MKSLGILLFSLFLSSGADAMPVESVRVYAAASLVEVLPKVAEAWNHDHPGTPVEAAFEGSAKLARQIESGAPADVFIPADLEWMDYLEKRHKIDGSTRVSLLSNRLVWIVPANAVRIPKSVSEVASMHYRRIALAGENVPISRYAQGALTRLGAWSVVEQAIIRGESVRTSLLWVENGDAQAAVVYRTDALSDKKVRIAFEFPESSHIAIVYPAAVTKGARETKVGRAFIAYLRSPESRALFEKFGFGMVQ